MPFTIKHNKRNKVQGSLETLRHQTLYPPPHTHTHTHLGEALSSMIQKLEKKREEGGRRRKEEDKKKRREEKKGRGNLTILLRSERRTLEMKVLHHVPKHFVVFVIYVIAPQDIVSQPGHFNTLPLRLGAYLLDLHLHSCPSFIIKCLFLQVLNIFMFIGYLLVNTKIEQIFLQLRVSARWVRKDK